MSFSEQQRYSQIMYIIGLAAVRILKLPLWTKTLYPRRSVCSVIPGTVGRKLACSARHPIIWYAARHIVVRTITMPRARWFGLRFPTGVHTGSGAHPVSYSVGTGILLRWEQSKLGVILTIRLHLAARLRMSGAIPLLHLWCHGENRDRFTFTYVNNGLRYDTGPWRTAGYSKLRHMNTSEILQ